MRRKWIVIGLIIGVVTIGGLTRGEAAGQSSSLYVRQTETAPEPMAPYRPPQRVNGYVVNHRLSAVSLTAVVPPEPATFAKHDLITIIIREQSTSTSEATLETEKEATVEGDVNAFPHLTLESLIEGQLRSARNPQDLPSVDVTGEHEFEGEGEYERRDTMTTRLTARVVGVKPNGTLTLEARTSIRNDDEGQTITVTGTCRAKDVGPDNTILSTQIFDLRISKQHEGELRKTTKKGLITKVLEAIFNF